MSPFLAKKKANSNFVVDMCVYFGFPRSSYYLWLKNGKPDYKAFDWNLAEHITASFKE